MMFYRNVGYSQTLQDMLLRWNVSFFQFGHVSTRFPTGLGITQFISSGDGQHVILFSSSPTQPAATFMYNLPASQAPYMIQQGDLLLINFNLGC